MKKIISSENFSQWNTQKTKLEQKQKRVLFKEKEISVLISQLRLLDSTRLHVKMGKLYI